MQLKTTDQTTFLIRLMCNIITILELANKREKVFIPVSSEITRTLRKIMSRESQILKEQERRAGRCVNQHKNSIAEMRKGRPKKKKTESV